jgi:hypothetical protein
MAVDRRQGDLRRSGDADAIQKAAIQGAKHQAKRSARGYFLLLLVLFGGAIAWQRSNDGRIVDAAKATCRRVDTLRVKESNRNAQVVWAALYHAWQRELKLASGSRGALHRRSAVYIKRSIDLMRWTPSTDCEQASQRPNSYHAPDPMPFDKRFLNFQVVPR